MNTNKERVTSQKKLILDFLKHTTSHPCAEEVYNSVRQKLPRISKGTVYRNLRNLVDKGDIVELNTDVSHFDAQLKPHAHFICQKCHRILDIFDDELPLKQLNTYKTNIGEINEYQLNFCGICEKCKNT